MEVSFSLLSFPDCDLAFGHEMTDMLKINLSSKGDCHQLSRLVSTGAPVFLVHHISFFFSRSIHACCPFLPRMLTVIDLVPGEAC